MKAQEYPNSDFATPDVWPKTCGISSCSPYPEYSVLGVDVDSLIEGEPLDETYLIGMIELSRAVYRDS